MYKSFLLIENPSKSNNLGPILRCCAAFAVEEVIFVGFAQCSAEGSHGSARHLKITAVPTFDHAVQYLKGRDCGAVEIIGLLGGNSSQDEVYSATGCVVNDITADGHSERLALVSIVGNQQDSQAISAGTSIFPRSKPVHCRPFRGNTAFSVSKNWRGLPLEQALICDSFVHVPHIPIRESQAMLVDVQASISIVLHHFTAWARHDERSSVGQKFAVSKFLKGKISEEEKEAKVALRSRNREESDNVLEEVAACDIDLFGNSVDGDDY